jgi:uncharacterized protein (DUF58 family)
MRFGWAQVGDQLEERFHLDNYSYLPALWVTVIDHSNMPGYNASVVRAVGPRNTMNWLRRGVCERRGVYTLGPTSLETGDPFGFYTLQINYFASSTMMVTPPVVSLPEVIIAPGGRAGEGRLQARTWDDAISASSVRDYHPGDSLHLIHWPTSARRDDLYVRTFDSTPSSDWWIFLDLDQNVQIGEGEDSTLEHGIILTASLANYGMQNGHQVGLVMSGHQLIWIAPTMGEDHHWSILRALALAKSGDTMLHQLLDSARPAIQQRSSLVLITPSLNHGWLNSAQRFARLGIIPTVLLLDPQSFGVSSDPNAMISAIASLRFQYHIITPSLLDSSEARPGQAGHSKFRSSPLGRAIPSPEWKEQPWKELS